nr:hypothetical protein [Tanacetum cinerariifolium]
CALLQKKFKEDRFTYCIENGIFQDFQDTSEPSNDNTNIVNALQETFVVKQDPGKNSSQSPPHINHHCCYGCGDSLEDILCHQCACESCGKVAHYGYNCPPKVLIVPNSEPCNNQTVDELPQTLPSFDPTCYSGDGNSFTYDSKSNIVYDSPNTFNPPPQTSTYSYEFCRNDAFYEERAGNINTQPFQYSVVYQPPQKEISVEFLQEKRKQINSVQTFLRKFNRISFYEMPKVLSLAWERILEIEHAFEDKNCQPEDILELFQRLHNDVQNIHEELAVYINTLSWDRPTICYNDDDDEDYINAIIPKEPNNSLNQFEDFSESNEDSTSIDDDYFYTDDIEYVEASPPDSELISLESSFTSLNFLLEETNTFDNSLPESETFCFDSEENSSGSTTTRANISLLDYEAFYDDHVKEISSGRDFTMDVVEDIFPTREPRVYVPNVLTTHPTLQLNLDFILSSESFFAYVVWIFLPYTHI